MRLVGRIKGKDEAFAFHTFLQKEGIDGAIDPAAEAQEFNIWIDHEDQVKTARYWMEAFTKDPEDVRFRVEAHPIDRAAPSSEPRQKPSTPGTFITMRRSQGARVCAPLTRLIIILCALLFIWDSYQLRQLPEVRSGTQLLNHTPLFVNLCYDISPAFIMLTDFLERYSIETPEDLENLSPAVAAEYEKIENTPIWSGIYGAILSWPRDRMDLEAPMFIKIRSGEVWRLFTPCLLHGGLLHILFNMLWLWLLGRQIEERINLWRYLVITLIIGTLSNTAQYLMSGPFFIGYSGVITGLAGFIWMRQRMAPWEGYPLNRGTLTFLTVFISGMLVLQLISFALLRFNLAKFPVNIANTAHITGIFVGALLGRIPFFSREEL